MHALNISTTRSLAVVTTGEYIMRETSLPGAILTRVASSHIRVGTFQYIAMKNDIGTLKNLVNYAINRHYPELAKENNQAIALLKVVIDTQIVVRKHQLHVMRGLAMSHRRDHLDTSEAKDSGNPRNR